MKRRILAAALMLIMVSSIATGCTTSKSKSSDGGNESSAGDKIKLTFLNKYPEEPYAQYFKDAVAEFEELNPNIDIEMENVSDEAIKDKLTVIASGGDMPDIYMSWTGERVKRFVRGGKALELTPYLKEDKEWANSFMPAFLNNSTIDGKTYAIPYRSGIMYMIYNKQVFEENQLETPTTWDELLVICEQLKDTGVTQIAFGNSSPWYASWWIGMLNAKMIPAATLETDYNPASGEFTDENYVKAVQAFLDLNNKGYFGSNVNSKDYYQVREEFGAGKAAMILEATQDFTQYDDIMGAENWGFFKIPSMEGAAGDAGTVGGGGEAWLVSASCKHPDAAIKFLKFMTSKEMADRQTTEAGLPNALVGGITEENATPALAEAYKEAESYTNVADWLDCAVEASIADQYMISLQEGLDGKSAEDVMKDVQKVAGDVKAEQK